MKITVHQHFLKLLILLMLSKPNLIILRVKFITKEWDRLLSSTLENHIKLIHHKYPIGQGIKLVLALVFSGQSQFRGVHLLDRLQHRWLLFLLLLLLLLLLALSRPSWEDTPFSDALCSTNFLAITLTSSQTI